MGGACLYKSHTYDYSATSTYKIIGWKMELRFNIAVYIGYSLINTIFPIISAAPHTVEPLNDGHIGTRPFCDVDLSLEIMNVWDPKGLYWRFHCITATLK